MEKEKKENSHINLIRDVLLYINKNVQLQKKTDV